MPICPVCEAHGPDVGTTCSAHPEHCLVDEQVLQRHPNDPNLGRILNGRYAIIHRVGRGGMGQVYEAIEVANGHRVALKLLSLDHLDDPVVRERFFREAEALKALNHPNLVTLLESGEAGEDLFMALELLQGESLQERLRNGDRLDGAGIVRLVIGIASGLAEAHRNGITHRDMKPANVMLVPGEEEVDVKLFDFGIAHFDHRNTVLTQTGMVFGTPTYMSPEQALGHKEVGPAADVYAVGVILYRMIAGSVPFHTEQPLAVLMMHVSQPPPELLPHPESAVPPELLALTLACLAKEPSERPANGDELLQRLRTISRTLGTDSTPSRPSDDAPPRQHPSPPEPSTPSSGLGPRPSGLHQTKSAPPAAEPSPESESASDALGAPAAEPRLESSVYKGEGATRWFALSAAVYGVVIVALVLFLAMKLTP